MTRVKRGTLANKKRSAILKYTKGFKWGRKAKESLAKQALIHAWQHAWRGRKEKKRDFRALWNTKINAALRPEGLNYSRFIDILTKKSIKLDRKILADLAQNQPETFRKVVESVK